jgi:hypothetical protein
MKSDPLNQCVEALREAGRSLDSELARTRNDWDDTARRAFDVRHLHGIVDNARQIEKELAGISADLRRALNTANSVDD